MNVGVGGDQNWIQFTDVQKGAKRREKNVRNNCGEAEKARCRSDEVDGIGNVRGDSM